jgi:sirohydrochlorin ferrochelatase
VTGRRAGRGGAARPAILLVDHGSRHPGANESLEQVAELLRRRVPGRIVRVAHMELAPPSIRDAIDACVADGAREIVVHPYFLAPGRHSTCDIPSLVGAAARRHPEVSIRVSEPLGAHEGLVEVILARVDAAASPAPRA